MSSHMDACAAQGWQWPLRVPERLTQNPWFLASCNREQELVIQAELRKFAWSDTSQTWGRTRHNFNFDAVPTLLPNSHIWSTELGRYLIGADAMALQGFPLAKMRAANKFSQSQLFDLAGNSFTTTVSMAVDFAILTNVNYAEPVVDSGALELANLTKSMMDS